jgi:hypothetical protein
MSFVASAGSVAVASGASFALTVPAGVVPTDVALVLAASGASTIGDTIGIASSGGTVSVTSLFGFSQYTNGQGAAALLSGASAGDALTINFAHSSVPVLLAAWYRGYQTTGYQLGSLNVRSGTGTTATAGPLTTEYNNSLVLFVFLDRASSVSTTCNLSGAVTVGDASQFGAASPGGANCSDIVAGLVAGAAGSSSGVATATWNASSTNAQGFTVELQPGIVSLAPTLRGVIQGGSEVSGATLRGVIQGGSEVSGITLRDIV